MRSSRKPAVPLDAQIYQNWLALAIEKDMPVNKRKRPNKVEQRKKRELWDEQKIGGSSAATQVNKSTKKTGNKKRECEREFKPFEKGREKKSH